MRKRLDNRLYILIWYQKGCNANALLELKLIKY